MANAKFRSQLLELVDSDSDDGLSGGLTRIAPTKSTKVTGATKAGNNNKVNKADKMPPAKKSRGRQPAASKVTKATAKTTSPRAAAKNARVAAAAEEELEEDSRSALVEKSTNTQQPKGRGRKRAAPAEEEVEDVEMEDAPAAPAPAKGTRGRPKKTALTVEEVPNSQPTPPAKGARGRKAAKAKKPEPIAEEPEEVVEGEEEEAADETTEIPETQQPENMTVEEVDYEQMADDVPTAKPARSLGRNSAHPRAAPPSPAKRPPFGVASPTKSSDPELRRRLGEMTQKYESIEQKYEKLREIAVRDAESNFEKLRKQTVEKSRVADELIASLKAELAAQREASKAAQLLKTQLEASETKLEALQTKNTELTTSLAESKTEIKALNMKLTAARTAEAAAAAKATAVTVPGSAVKGPGPSSRMNMMTTSNSEAVRQATLKGQKREDLYADLTGLIIRTIPSTSNGTGKDDAEVMIYDCIQTGRNGTLHFKLRECDDVEGPGDEPQLRYMPQLDPNRDRSLMEILPDYLVDEIEFPRAHVDKFYARVVKALTGA
ncbi:Chromosome segregation protein Csm1/Pcs1 domain containing protein [Naviculisporaceae sp. PSN 640]